MSPDDFRKVIGIGSNTRDVPFAVIMVRLGFLALAIELTSRLQNTLYKIARTADFDVNLSVNDPSQQWKFGQPLIATVSSQ